MLRFCRQRISTSKRQLGFRSFRSSLIVKKMVDVELLNLSEETENVRIGDKFYRLNAKNDEISFENFPSKETSSKGG